MNRKVRAIIVDGTEIMTSYTAVEIADRLRTYDDLKDEINRLNNIINELEKGIFKIRQSTFTKYNSNEWNNCLSYEDDIAPLLKIIHKSRELKESSNNE